MTTLKQYPNLQRFCLLNIMKSLFIYHDTVIHLYETMMHITYLITIIINRSYFKTTDDQYHTTAYY